MNQKFFTQLFKKFILNTNGAVALIVGIALIFVLIAILSLNIDLGRTQTSYNKNQAATDAAATGTAEFILKGITNQIGKRTDPFNYSPDQDSAGSIQNYADTLLRQNFSRDQSSGIYDPTSLKVNYVQSTPDSKTGVIQYRVNVTACANLNAPFAVAAKHATSTRSCTTSTAAFSLANLNNLEIAFALDFTNSMRWSGDTTPPALLTSPPNFAACSQCIPFAQTKAKALVDAMNYVFNNDTYFPKNANSTVFASIIPYSGLVNIYPYNKTMLSGQQPLSGATVPGYPSPRPNPIGSIDWPGPSYNSGEVGSAITNPFGQDFGQNLSFAFNWVPAIPSAAWYNNFLSATNTTTQLPFPTYLSVYESLQGTVPETVRTSKCFDGVVAAALDQRILRLEIPGSVGLAPTVSSFAGGKIYEMNESFPIQPLTNNTSILESVVNRYTTGSDLFSNNSPAITTGASANTVDRQANVLDKAQDWSFAPETSSIHGLLWAWLTINNDWKDKWDAKSLHETTINGLVNPPATGDQSQQSRQGLPSADHIKHIIFLTDGHDTDGENSSSVCDAYSPTAPFSTGGTTDRFVQLCTRIKNENTKIHVLMLDFTDTASHDRYSACASPGEFYENVQPSQVQTIMDGIFRSIVTNLSTVRLVNQ